MASAPGRINLIGEHTDYNNGFVLPAAIDRKVRCAIGPNDSGEINAFALDLNESASIDPKELSLETKPDWVRFVAGVARVIIEKGYDIDGFNIVFNSDIPIGAGLSSSAAIESAVGTGLNHLFNPGLNKEEIALTGQSAEHNYVGVKCGIMDQYASVFGKEDHAILLDCRSLDGEYIPVNLGDYKIVLCNSGVKHSLASSEYNTRRKECEKGVALIKDQFTHVESLRDVNMNMLAELKSKFEEKIWDRCSYVVEENLRVMKTCDALKSNKIQSVGECLYQSHDGLSKKYEVSCPELDFLVDKTRSMQYVAGSRMMGGGFGGCTINIVKSDSEDRFIEQMSKLYQEKFSLELESYSVRITNGSGVDQIIN